MKYRPQKPLCPLLCLAEAYVPAFCQEEHCAWYIPGTGCAVCSLSRLEDIADKE